MDLAAFKAHALARSRIEHAIGGRSFVLRAASRHDIEVATLQVAAEVGRRHARSKAFGLAMFRRLVEVALMDWRGVTAADLVDELPAGAAAAEPVAFDPELAQLFLDRHKAVADELAVVLAERAERDHAALDAAKKNSPPGAPGGTAPSSASA